MVSKVFSGHSFYHACRYVVNKPGAEVLECEGVRGHNFKVMSDDFIMQQQLRPEKEKACFHCSLSFYPGEKLSDEKKTNIAKEYLQRLNIINTQFAITKHTDRRHLHLHIVANMVNNNGKAISDSFLGLRGKKIAQQLTNEHKLIPALKKNLELTNYYALHKSEGNKYKVYQAIMNALPSCRTMKDLENKLQSQGIETQYKYKGETLEKQGVSFKISKDCFKGRQVDRQFSLGNLEKTLALNQKKMLELKPESRVNSPNNIILIKEKQTDRSPANTDDNFQANDIGKGLVKIVDILLKPEQDIQQTPSELLKAGKKKRKKISRNRGMHHYM